MPALPFITVVPAPLSPRLQFPSFELGHVGFVSVYSSFVSSPVCSFASSLSFSTSRTAALSLREKKYRYSGQSARIAAGYGTGATREGGKDRPGVDSAKPPDPPRLDCLRGSKVTLGEHVLGNWDALLVVFSVSTEFLVLTSDGKSAMLFPRWARAAAAAFSIIVTATSYVCHGHYRKKRHRLYETGIATKARVSFVGIEEDENSKHAWVARWKYTVDGVEYDDVAPLKNVIAGR